MENKTFHSNEPFFPQSTPTGWADREGDKMLNERWKKHY